MELSISASVNHSEDGGCAMAGDDWAQPQVPGTPVESQAPVRFLIRLLSAPLARVSSSLSSPVPLSPPSTMRYAFIAALALLASHVRADKTTTIDGQDLSIR